MVTPLGLASLVATVLAYTVVACLHRRFRWFVLSPMVLVPSIVVAVLVATRVDYAHYAAGAGLLSRLLGPAVVAFAIPLHRNLPMMKRNAPELVAGVSVGTVVAVVTSVTLATALGLKAEVVRSIAPRSVTTPIAMAISRGIGGIPAVTAVLVILTGLVGLAIGPALQRVTRFRSPVARGVMLGMGAHACGTSQAMTHGAVEGTSASVAMTLAGIAGILVTPFLTALLRHVA